MKLPEYRPHVELYERRHPDDSITQGLTVAGYGVGFVLCFAVMVAFLLVAIFV